MAVIATIMMNLQVRNEAEVCDAINEILRGEQSAFKAGSQLVDYRFDTPSLAPYGYFEARVQLYLDVPSFSDAVKALSNVLDWQTQEAVSSSSLLEWFETCLEAAEPVPEHYWEGTAFVGLSWGALNRFDKSGLSDLLAVIDSALQGLNTEILNLKPHERKAEGYSEDDYQQAMSTFELANSLRDMFVRKMAACDGDSAEASNLASRFNAEHSDLFEQTDLCSAEIKELVDLYSAKLEDVCQYSTCRKFLEAIEVHGFTFDYGLDGVPFGLRKKEEEQPAVKS